MKLYQVEHDNCEPYEDNYTHRENAVYTDKEKLIQDIKKSGYKEEIDYRGRQRFIKTTMYEYTEISDAIEIHELTIIDNNGGTSK